MKRQLQMEMELQMRQKTSQTKIVSSFHCVFNSTSSQSVLTSANEFKTFKKLVNAGGFDEKDVQEASC